MAFLAGFVVTYVNGTTSDIQRLPSRSTPAVRTVDGTRGISPSSVRRRPHVRRHLAHVRDRPRGLRRGARTRAFRPRRTSGTSGRLRETRSSTRRRGWGGRVQGSAPRGPRGSFSCPVGRSSPNRAQRCAVEPRTRHQRAGVRLAQKNAAAGVLERAESAQRHVAEGDERDRRVPPS